MIEVYDMSWRSDFNTAVALGYFDGVHIAHRYLVSLAADYARHHGLKTAVFTYTKHIKLSHKGKDLYTPGQKIEKMQELGVDLFYSPDFSRFSQLTPRQFVEDVLIKSMGAKAVVCGENFFFGRDRRGNVRVLEELCREHGIHFIKADTMSLEGEIISSTSVRGAVEAGDMEKAKKLLGRPYCVELEVVHGKKLGRTMGTPTINQIYPENMCTPKEGVYITCTTVDGVKYPSATGFGRRPTVNSDMQSTCETYIKGFSGDLYGRIVKVEFYKFLFETKKFDNLDQLRDMILDAAEQAEEYLAGAKE